MRMMESVSGSPDLTRREKHQPRQDGSARRDSVLLRLVQHFSKINLRNSNLSEPDMLGGAYEFLIEHFADDAGKKGGEFYTPRKVVELIVSLLAPTEGMRIHDPKRLWMLDASSRIEQREACVLQYVRRFRRANSEAAPRVREEPPAQGRVRS